MEKRNGKRKEKRNGKRKEIGKGKVFVSEKLGFPGDMSCHEPGGPCRPCGPTPLAKSCTEPWGRQGQDSTVLMQPSPMGLTLPAPILTSCPHNTGMDLYAWRDVENQTTVQEFLLLGFPGTWHFRVSLAVLFALMYSLTVTGNASIIALVWANRTLHTPMYFFLCNLSFLEICYTTGVVPKAVGVLLGTSHTISFRACILQLFFLLSLGSTECFLLALMAYDRYLAVCHPLRYSSLMTNVLSAQLALASWLGGFLAISLLAFLTARLTFCGPRVINHFLCDIDSCLALACMDTWPVELATFIVSIIVVVLSCVLTLLSYLCIISAILSIQTAQGRHKAFSTCSAHLTVVTIWFGSTMFLYVKPSAQNSLDLNKLVNTFNTIVTPLLNPFIYTLRNKEVARALHKAFQKQ
ncbi:olfactory receptor 6F1-like [Eudromia elegans]